MANYIYYDYMDACVCKVQEDKCSYESFPNIESYLNACCLENGSSLKGRRQSFSHAMHINRYIPIVIDLEHIFFPIHPIRQYDCIWINYANIQSITTQKKMCTITFHDHTHLDCYHPQRILRNMYIIRQYLQML